MQKTPNLHLNTWAEADPVDLDQINENFEILDADTGEGHTKLSHHSEAIRTLAFHAAHRAMEAYHANTLSDAVDDLVLADFSKPEEWSEVQGVELTENSVRTMDSGYTGFTQHIPHTIIPDNAWRFMCEFEAKVTGSITAIELPVVPDRCPDHQLSVCKIRIKEGSTVIAQSETVFEETPTALSGCNIVVGHKYTLEAYGTRLPYNNELQGTMRVQVTPSANSAGHFVSKDFELSGSRLYFWLTASGNAPRVSILDHQDEERQLTAENTADVQDLYGNPAVKYYYSAPIDTWDRIRIKVHLSGTSAVTNLCGIAV